MVAALVLAVLAASSERCVRLTDVCAPDGATFEGEVQNGYGGTVTITSPTAWRTLGVRFVAKERVVVSVNPWSSSTGERGAVVFVEGVLERPQRLSGVVVTGRVAVMQEQSARPRAAPLVRRLAPSRSQRIESRASRRGVPCPEVKCCVP